MRFNIRSRAFSQDFVIAVGVVFFLFIFVLALPFVFAWDEKYVAPTARIQPFTVTVDVKNKTIVEDPTIESLLSGGGVTLSAAAHGASGIFSRFSLVLSQSSLYSSLAAVGVPRLIVVDPGSRREEVALQLKKSLQWDAETHAEYLSLHSESPAGVPEGVVPPGLYSLHEEADPQEVDAVFEKRFQAQVLSRYATSTEEAVPLKDALTIASMIQRETGNSEEMRVISGIIWNRIFAGMPLQLDATLQYAKANARGPRNGDWWPVVYPKDKYIKSPFNTYQNEGLPPAPISNPSLSAVVAALNPKKTDCMFYFHDRFGGFHCSVDYEGHVALLKKHYGRGK